MSVERKRERETETPRDRRLTTEALTSDSIGRVRASPTLALPFVLLGLLLTGLDYVRVRDPVPVEVTPYSIAEGVTIRSEFYPTGLSETTTTVDALVGLKLQYLAWVVGVELLGLVAIVVAGGVVVSRVTDTPLSTTGLLRYATFIVALWFVPSVNFSGASIVVGLLVIVPAYYVSVRLFALPALLIQGDGVETAARRSWALTSGLGWSVFVLVVALGVCYSVLALVPVVGPALSTSVAGTLHAVSLGLFVERASERLDDATPPTVNETQQTPETQGTRETNPANTSD